MSTAGRPTTRAQSKASSRGASPAFTDYSSTPRTTTRRAGPGSLPAVNLRASTAYGDNTLPPPASSRGRYQTSATLDASGTLLKGILAPTPEDTASRGNGRARGWPKTTASSVDPDRTHTFENNAFEGAAFSSSCASSQKAPTPEVQPKPVKLPASRPASSEFSHPSKLNGMHGHSGPSAMKPTSKTSSSEFIQSSRLMSMPELKSQPANKPASQAASLEMESEPYWKPVFSEVLNLVLAWLTWSCDMLKSCTPYVIPTVAGLLFIPIAWFWISSAASSLSNGSTYMNEDSSFHFYGPLDIRHNVGQFIPGFIAHPLDTLSPDLIKGVSSDIRSLDYKYSSLKHKTDIDRKTIERIEKALPDFLVVKKDHNGNTEIPHDFWGALRSLIQSDDDLISTSDAALPPGKPASGSSVNVKDFDKKAGQVWDKYIATNRAKLTSWATADFEDRFPHLFKKNIIASKSEILDLVRQNWNDNRDSVKHELTKLQKELDQHRAHIQKIMNEPSGLSQDKLKTVISSQIHKLLPVAQLEALIRSNQKGNVNWGLSRVNYWSHGTGAVIDKRTTSPNYAFPNMRQSGFKRFGRWLIGNPIPTANPPAAALEKWEEHGDCWCAPADDNDGFGPTIGVISGYQIIPDQVVIEHIAAGASLEPGATPREMELLAYVPDFNTYDAVSALSKELFGEPHNMSPFTSSHYIKVADWVFNAGEADIQAFAIQIDLGQFGASTNRLIARAKNNWGGELVGYTCLYRVRVHGKMAKNF